MNTHTQRNCLRVFLGATASWAVIAMSPAIALAQSQTPTTATLAAQKDAANQVNVLEDVVVTARKKTERAIDVPISLVTFGDGQLTKKSVVQLQDLATYVPNFRQTNGATGSFRSIRGGGSPGSNFSFEQSTGLFFDNISYGRNVHSLIPIFDVERVEVLRGPQVIAFGNSTTSGAISITSRTPGHDFSGNFDGTYEFENHEAVVRGGVDIPLSERLSLRVSGFAQRLDKGWVKNIRPDGDLTGPRLRNYAGRVMLYGQLTDTLTIKAKYEHDDLTTLGSSMQAVFNPANDPNIVESNLDHTTYAYQPAPYDQRLDMTKMNADVALLELTNEIGEHTLVSTTGYTRYSYDQDLDADVGPKAISATHPADDYKQFTQEFRLTGPLASNLTYQAGVYYQHEEQAPRFLFNNGVVYGRLAGLDTTANQWSAFGGLTWKPAEKWSIDVGARYTDIARTSDQWVVGTVPLTFTPLPSSPIIARTLRDIKTPDNFLMPQVVVAYQPSRELNFYAKYVQGDKAGGVDSQYVAPPATANVDSATFDSEGATSYEAGMKSYLWDRKMSLDVAIFRSNFKDLQVNSYNVVTNAFEIRNAGKSVSQGVEVETVISPGNGLKLNVSVGYLDAHFKDFTTGPCTPEQALLVTGACFQDLSGKRTPFNSKWTASGGAEYRFELGEFSLTPRFDLTYRSSYNPTTNNDPLLQRKGFTLVDARIDLSPSDGRYTVALYGKNLTDKIYNEVALGAPFTNRVRLGDTSRGRQIGLSVSTKF